MTYFVAIVVASAGLFLLASPSAFAEEKVAPAARATTQMIPFVRPNIAGIEFPTWLTELTPPRPDTPSELARYFGVWAGSWGDTAWGNTQGVTVVHKVTPDHAFVVFCHAGTARFSGGCSSGAQIPFKKGKLAGVRGTSEIEYSMKPDGTLNGHSSFVLPGERGVIHWWGHGLTRIGP